MTPTARSLALLRSRGFEAGIAEQRVPIPRSRGRIVTRDLFGVADIVFFDARITGLCQSTTMDHLAERERKVREWSRLMDWLAGDRRFVLHGWALKGPAGKRKLWEMVEREITLDGRAV